MRLDVLSSSTTLIHLRLSIGENLYNLLDYQLQSEFKELRIPSEKWKYINRDIKKSFRIYIQR